MKNIRYERLTAESYAAYLALCNQQILGQILLPKTFTKNMWGIMAYLDDNFIGGWVGTLRGDKPIVRMIAKGVWFDSYPIFTDAIQQDENLRNDFVKAVKNEAHKDGIVLLNLTHWVRNSKGMEFDSLSTEATFLIDLNHTDEDLFALVERNQRNKIRKGDNSGVIVEHYAGKDALAYLQDFQNLRQTTQSRAIQNNKNASMLLKSDDFFTNIFIEQRSRLFITKYEDVVVSVALILEGGKTAYYYSGGSNIEVNKKTAASAYLVWKVICYYREQGYTFFDMGGVPANPDSSHPAYGVYSFKKSFGGEYKEFLGGKIIIQPFKYRILNCLLNQRKLLRFISRNEK